LENDDVDFKRASESIRENIKATAIKSLRYYELKQHKIQFDNECSKPLDQRQKAKL
jgi:hypothetical protein